MYVQIRGRDQLLPYRIVRGGKAESEKVLIVQQARLRDGKLRAIHGLPCQRVKVIATDDILGEKDVPTITVQWMGLLA